MRYIVGIDEVGRGPLAGPVMVAAVLVPSNFRLKKSSSLSELRDSKKLTAKQREAWSEYLLSHPKVRSVVAKCGPMVIDRINISKAANVAAARAFNKLILDNNVRKEECAIYLDGGLYLGNGKARMPAKTVVKGDERIPAVAMASIVAKVARDRSMTKLAKIFPEYGFERHKGYATRAHYLAIKNWGLTPMHRASFTRNI